MAILKQIELPTIIRQNTAAVQQATVTIKQGSFVVIVGSSGSGKSTLGKLLCGLDHPTNGQFSRRSRATPLIQLPCDNIAVVLGHPLQ